MQSVNSAINAVLAARASATQQQIGIALLAKAQAATKQQGQAIVQLLEATTHLGKAPGKGENFDAVG